MMTEIACYQSFLADVTAADKEECCKQDSRRKTKLYNRLVAQAIFVSPDLVSLIPNLRILFVNWTCEWLSLYSTWILWDPSDRYKFIPFGGHMKQVVLHPSNACHSRPDVCWKDNGNASKIKNKKLIWYRV